MVRGREKGGRLNIEQERGIIRCCRLVVTVRWVVEEEKRPWERM
jgi:hypothetical protein